MSLLNRFGSRSISVFLIPVIIFFVTGLFVVSSFWPSDFVMAVEESPTPTPEPEGGKLSGYKFEDLNGNGKWDDDEPVLNDWAVYLYIDTDDEWISATTGDGDWPDGYYEFNGLENQEYYICEEAKEDWTETYPNTVEALNADLYDGCEDDGDFFPYGYFVEIDGDSVDNLNFGNFEYGYISGHKYAEETNEKLDGWRIYLIDPDNNRRRRTTNEEGYYYFGDLGPGIYKVCEATEEDEETGEDVCATHSYQTYPETFYTVDMRSGGKGLASPGNPKHDFRNYTKGVVKAFKFKDLDWDEEQDEGEPAVSGWNMCLYEENDNGWSLVGDECKPTDETGWAVWTNLDLGFYRLDEENRDGWTHTTGNSYEFELDEDNLVYSRKFGNIPNELKVIKFYDTDGDGEQNENEEVLSGWEFCLYRVVWPDGGEYPIYEPAFEDEDDFCRKTDDSGSILWSELPEGDYLVDEEERENWFHTDTDENGRREVEVEEGRTTEKFGNVRNVIKVLKFWDKNQNGERDGYWQDEDESEFIYTEPALGNWQFCLDRWNPETEEWDLVECKSTNGDGWVWWEDLEDGSYKVVEIIKEDWLSINFESGIWDGIEIENGEGEQVAYFGNWIEDEDPPVSQFDQPRRHEVIDTEIVSLELTGRSYDRGTGVKEAEMTIYQLGGPESVQDYPAQSFFDVFTELECPTRRLVEPSPSPTPSPIPIEIVALNLVSVDPITVNWRHNWVPPSSGTYCWEVKATDYANNVEQTAWAGPLAYVPVVQISDNEIATGSLMETSFTAEWQTNEPATSRVIYDTISHQSLREAPNYGYAFSTVEQDLDPRVTDHAVTVSGLNPGTTYYYRMISAASPESVSGENSTTTSQQQSSSGGGGGGNMGVIIWPVPTPTSTPTSMPALALALTLNSNAGDTTAGTSAESGAVQGSTSSTSTSGSGSSMTESESLITQEGSVAEESTSPGPEAEESNNGENMMASMLGLLLGSVSLWWMVILATTVAIYAIINRK